MNDQLKKLYQSVIIKHNNDPLRFEKRKEATEVLEAYNQICGDRFKLYFDLENGLIQSLSFHGFGCAISKASTSILVKHLEGKSLEEAKLLLSDFYLTIEEEKENTPEDFQAFAAAKSFPGRLKCATLAWDELQQFLNTSA